MSSLLDMLSGQLGQEAVRQVSRQLGADEETTQQAIGAALPMLVGALDRNASSTDGAEALSRALQRDHDGSILDDLSTQIANPETAQTGAAILGHVLGGKQGNVETGISRTTGLDQGSTGQLLAMLAPVVLGALGKQQRSQGLDAGALAGLLGNERQATESSLGGLSQLLDMDGDGEVTDDILNMGVNLLGGWLKNR